MSEIINNREHRIETMRTIIEQLHEGADPESVRAELTELVRETDGSEIAAMEQQLIDRGMPAEKIQSMCDLHADVLRDITTEPQEQRVAPGHPIDTFKLENFAIGNAVEKLKKRLEAYQQAAGKAKSDALDDLREVINSLMDIDKHYARKEQLLFPYLEKRGISGPSQVMWAKDDEARALLKQAEAALSGDDDREIVTSVEAAANSIGEMIYKENNILLPMSAETLTEEEWGEIFNGSPEIGWCIVPPRQGYKPPQPKEPAPAANIPSEKTIALPTGNLSLEQLTAIFGTLPLDMTFIDDDDRVAWFSHGPDRIFARTAAVIGRKVQHCHPPKSVDTVERILDDFKSGRQDSAAFWINFQGVFVHIRYFAVRDGDSKYLGTLELTQDVTSIRELSGERRLLEYD